MKASLISERHCVRAYGCSGTNTLRHVGCASQRLLTGEPQRRLSADHGPEGVGGHALVGPRVAGSVGATDQQAAFHHTVAEIHARVNIRSIELPPAEGECREIKPE